MMQIKKGVLSTINFVRSQLWCISWVRAISWFIRTRDFRVYYKDTDDTEVNEIVEYMRETRSYGHFCYAFKDNYDERFKADIEYDTAAGMYYVNDVISNGKKMYFSPKMDSPSKVRDYYKGLCVEQDLKSPHRYLTKEFDVEEGDCVADLGVAEGNFALSVVDRVKELYLFECSEDWIEALEKTFEPWKDKVHIVKCFVSNRTGGGVYALG